MRGFPSMTLMLVIVMLLFVGQVVLKPTLFVDMIPGPGGVTFNPAVFAEGDNSLRDIRNRNKPITSGE